MFIKFSLNFNHGFYLLSYIINPSTCCSLLFPSSPFESDYCIHLKTALCSIKTTLLFSVVHLNAVRAPFHRLWFLNGNWKAKFQFTVILFYINVYDFVSINSFNSHLKTSEKSMPIKCTPMTSIKLNENVG